MKKLNSEERKKLLCHFRDDVRVFITDYNQIYEDEKEQILKYIEKPFQSFYGILQAIRDTNTEKYFYIYKTPDNKIGYLTRQVYLKWLAKGKDEQVKRNKGIRVAYGKFIKRMPFFARWVKRDGSIEIKKKFMENEIRLSSETAESFMDLIVERLRDTFTLEIKRIGDGWSHENWIKAYSIDLCQNWSDVVSSSYSCMRSQSIGEQAVFDRTKFCEVISNEGQNVQIYGIYNNGELVGRFKLWFWKGKKLVDRIYCIYKYKEQAIREIREIKDFTTFNSSEEKAKLFKDVYYKFDKNLFSNMYFTYMDTMSYLIIPRNDKQNVYLTNSGLIEGIETEYLISLRTSLEKVIFRNCKICGKPILDNYTDLCTECFGNYTKCDTINGYKYLKNEDVYYSNEYNYVISSCGCDIARYEEKLFHYLDNLCRISKTKKDLINKFLGREKVYD